MAVARCNPSYRPGQPAEGKTHRKEERSGDIGGGGGGGNAAAASVGGGAHVPRRPTTGATNSERAAAWVSTPLATQRLLIDVILSQARRDRSIEQRSSLAADVGVQEVLIARFDELSELYSGLITHGSQALPLPP